MRGYLTGSIDLVLRAGDRFAVLDYKTNWLGAPGEKLTARHYRADALAAAMERSHYGLQALLYLVALHRYLRWRLPGYDPERNLAGAGYLFLRGMTGDAGAGVFAWQPPGAVVERLSDVLERGAMNSALAARATGALREFNAAGVLAPADVHVAQRLAAIALEDDEQVMLAVAFAVRGPRLGHVYVDLETIRDTATVDAEEPVDLTALPWPVPAEWLERAGRQPARGGGGGGRRRAAAAARRLGALPRPLLARGAPGGGRSARARGPPRASPLARLAAVRRPTASAPPPRPPSARRGHRRRPRHRQDDHGGAQPRPLLEQGADPSLVALAAPTGKAAARLSEAVHEEAARLDIPAAIREHLLALEASTLHRLLGWRPGTHSRFRHARTNRLPYDIVIVDETSMVSLSLMARLIEAVRPDARLILVGDPGQLTSIEAGAVLGDIVAASEGIVTPRARPSLRRRDRGGRRRDPSRRRRRHRGGARRRGVDRPTPTPCAKAPSPASAPWPTPPARAPARRAIEALGGFRILCAHRRGPHGVTGWTARVEGWLAQAGLAADGDWYAGRPLLVTENDYGLGLYNGDTGVVIAAGDGRLAAVFERRRELAEFSPTRLGAVDTVYAMTVHKSQGSQFGTAAVLLPDASSPMLTSELLYTAVTRARDRLILVGDEAAVRAAVARPVVPRLRPRPPAQARGRVRIPLASADPCA